MRILVFNQTWMIEEFRAAGHEVKSVGMHPECDVRHVPPLVHIDTILSKYLDGFEPDRIVFWDNSAPITVLGIEDTRYPIFFYSVDTHHHFEYHRYLAHVFDSTLIAQRDYLHHFADQGERVGWMPLWASRWVDPSPERNYGPVFVGNMDRKLNPLRVEFFDRLKALRDVYTTMGEYWRIFPHAQCVINQTVKGDLNFRVFEVMMCGVPLLTERAPNGLGDLFTEGVHYLGYERNDPEDAARQIDWITSHPERCAELARTARDEVVRNHLPQHRAAQVDSILRALVKRDNTPKRFPMFMNFSVLARRMEAIDTTYAKKALLHAMRIVADACRDGESMTMEIACHCVFSAITYDRVFQSVAGENLIRELAERYPKEKILQLSLIRSLLNRGSQQAAQAIAEAVFEEPPREIFRNAETVVAGILSSLME